MINNEAVVAEIINFEMLSDKNIKKKSTNKTVMR